MNTRSNEEWLEALAGPPGERQNAALVELRDYLLRAVLVYFSSYRNELAGWDRQAVYDLAEDLTQEALVRILDSLDGFQGKSRFTTWAYRFVINQAASELRRQRYRDVSLDRLQEAESVTFQELLAGQAEVDPEQQVEQRDYLHLLYEIIRQELNERQRLAIVGVYLLGYPMDQVARVLGLNRNALYKLLYDARRRLKSCLLEHHLTRSDILAAFDED
jgi:RNA polymerase sigma-70 factor, ECF subfamily